MADPLQLEAQATPNPNALKFTLNRVVAAQGTTYREASQAAAGWARELLGIPGVTQVFALQQFISVTKRPEADWNQLGPQVEQILTQAFA